MGCAVFTEASVWTLSFDLDVTTRREAGGNWGTFVVVCVVGLLRDTSGDVYSWKAIGTSDGGRREVEDDGGGIDEEGCNPVLCFGAGGRAGFVLGFAAMGASGTAGLTKPGTLEEAAEE